MCMCVCRRGSSFGGGGGGGGEYNGTQPFAVASSKCQPGAKTIYIYIIYSQDTVIDNIIAILYECELCAV